MPEIRMLADIIRDLNAIAAELVTHPCAGKAPADMAHLGGDSHCAICAAMCLAQDAASALLGVKSAT